MKKDKIINIFTGKVGIGVITGLICLTIGGSFGVSKYLLYKGIALETEEKLKKLEINYGTLEGSNKQLQEKLNEAKPWFEMKEEERVKHQKEASPRFNEKKGSEIYEEELDKEKEHEDKVGYDTGITYEQLVKSPHNYLGNKIKFSGTVLQVLENNIEMQIRLAIDDDYKNNILCAIPKSLIENKEIAENDKVTVMGVSLGLVTHKITSEASITIPGIMVDEVQ